MSSTVGIRPVAVLIIIIRCVSNTLVFWKNIEDFALLLGVPLLVIFARRFLEEATKLTDIFSNRFQTSWIVVPYGFLRGLCYCHWVRNFMNARLVALLWNLACPLFTCFLGGSPKFLEGLFCDCKRYTGKYFSELCFVIT